MEKIVKLSKAISAHGETLTEIAIPKLTIKHMRGFPIGGFKTFGELLDFFGEVTGLPPSSMDQLAVEDAVACVEGFVGFLPGVGATGGTPSP
jgi:hypothetical protein